MNGAQMNGAQMNGAMNGAQMNAAGRTATDFACSKRRVRTKVENCRENGM